MAEPDDGLGLSLRCPEKQSRRLPPPPDAFPSGSPLQQPTDLRGIDMNRPIESDDHLTWTGIGMVSSPNSTLSRSSFEIDEDSGRDRMGRKKLYLSKDQTAVLEETFKEHNILNSKQKMAVAKRLNLRARQVEVWFQNRRARTKLKQTEVDCCYMRHCFKNLTEENRRLVKEVTELRALKLPPQFYTNMSTPTAALTVSMCPQCQRAASRPSLSLGPP